MPSSHPQLRPWWRASSLAERLALSRRLEPVETTVWDQAATRWQQESFLPDEVFARRLAAAGVSRQELGRALLPSFEPDPAGYTGPEWTEAIDRVARHRLSGLAWEELSALEGAGLKRPPKPPFFGFVSRFLQDGADRLRRLPSPAPDTPAARLSASLPRSRSSCSSTSWTGCSASRSGLWSWQ
jgi:hypothetical protein